MDTPPPTSGSDVPTNPPVPSPVPPAPAPTSAPAPVPTVTTATATAEAAARHSMVDLRNEVAKVVVGQEGTLSGLVAALLANGHVLLEGVPGVAKTLLAKTMAAALDLEFGRIQFTPDMMPADVTGQVMLDGVGGQFKFRQGPVFTNLLLADEVNRTPPKTQAALLEAMEERQVSVDGVSHKLPDPFLVVATENPVEYEGTYPLPEAQLDRFMFKLMVGYPTAAVESEVLSRHNQGLDPHDIAGAGVRPVTSMDELARARKFVDAVTVERPVIDYIVALCRATRDVPSVQLGVSPRGAASMLHAAKAWAWLAGRNYVTPDEVKAVAKPALRHRVIIRPELQIEGVTADGVLDTLLASVPAPR